MGYARRRAAEHRPAMQTPGLAALDVLPRRDRRVGREPEADAIDRRAVPAHAVLRFARDDAMVDSPRLRRESQARAAAHARQRPEIFNTDQGAQFTSQAFTGLLEATGIAISMDGRGRALDNVFIERLWRTVKYENIYLHGYETAVELERGLAAYFDFYR